MSRSSTDRLRRALAAERGTAVLETALVSALLLTLALGIVEFGNAFGIQHTMTSLSREGANIAARGTPLGDVVEVVVENGTDIALETLGGVVASRITVQGGSPVIVEQAGSSGFVGSSRIGSEGGAASGMDGFGLEEGQSVHVVEVFYNYPQVTPFGSLVGVVVPDVLYERAIF